MDRFPRVDNIWTQQRRPRPPAATARQPADYLDTIRGQLEDWRGRYGGVMARLLAGVVIVFFALVAIGLLIHALAKSPGAGPMPSSSSMSQYEAGDTGSAAIRTVDERTREIVIPPPLTERSLCIECEYSGEDASATSFVDEDNFAHIFVTMASGTYTVTIKDGETGQVLNRFSRSIP